MRVLRPALAAAAAAAVVLASGASAATTTFTDLTGDANLISDQGLLVDDPVPQGTVTPIGSQNDYDITKLTFSPLGTARACKGYVAILEVAGAVSKSNALYRIQGTTAVNDNLFWLQYSNRAVGGETTTLRYGAGSASVTVPLTTPAKVEGNKVTFTVLEKDLKTAGEKLGVVVLGPGADVRNALPSTPAAAPTVPMWDQLETTSDTAAKTAC